MNFKILALLTFVVFSFTSCFNDKDHLGKQKIEDITNWTFETGVETNNSTMEFIPTIGESGNIYFMIQNNYGQPLFAFALDQNGTQLWKLELEGDTYSRFIYKNSKLYYMSLEGPKRYVNCLNSSDGSIVWKREITFNEYQNYAIAISNQAIVVGIKDSIVAIDFDGSTIGKQFVGAQEFYAISISGNEIFATWSTVNNGYGHLSKYTLNDLSFEHNWTYDATDGCFSRDISIDDNGNSFVTFHGTDNGLFCFKNDGSIKWQTAPDFIISSSNDEHSTTITSDGEILAGGGHLYKFSQDGNIVWQTNSETIPTISVRQAPNIGANGKFYYQENSPIATLSGVRAFNTDGSYYWYCYKPTSSYYSVLNRNGDLLVLSYGTLYSISTESNGLGTGQWSKMYNDYGNTASK